MFDVRKAFSTAILLLVAGPATAVTVYQCEDENGSRTFESACPPGTTPVGERDYGSAAALAVEEESEAPPEITLYVVPECEACTQIREFLDLREIPYSTRDVSNDAVLQLELRKRAGELRAPTVLVGEKAVVGYNRTALIAALQESGHITAEEEPEGTGGAVPGETAEEATPAP